MCSYPLENINIPHFRCVLKCCNNCPALSVPDEEISMERQLPRIKFHVYKDIYRCSLYGQLPLIDGDRCLSCVEQHDVSKRGKVHTKRELVLLDDSISTFHSKFYKPAIEKLAYNLSHVKILGS